MKSIEIGQDFVTLREKPLILKLRSLGAGIEEAEETKLSLLEAAYFADRNVLPLKKEDLLKQASKNDPLTEEKYFVIKYLRDLGYIVRPSLDGTSYLRLHRKGYRPGEDKTYYLIEVVRKDWKADAETLMRSFDVAGKLRKELVLAIVDMKQDKPLFIKFERANFE